MHIYITSSNFFLGYNASTFKEITLLCFGKTSCVGVCAVIRIVRFVVSSILPDQREMYDNK
jgi:hypothetical protein